MQSSDRTKASSRSLAPRRPPVAPGRGEIAWALGGLYGGTGLLALLAMAWPPVTSWLQALLAVLLLVIPGRLLARHGARIDDLGPRGDGVALGPWRGTLRLSLVTMLLVFPPFVLGYHVLETHVLHAKADWSLGTLEHWDQVLDGLPPDVCAASRHGVAAWMASGGLWVIGSPEETLTLTTRAPVVRDARRVRCTPGRAPRATEVLTPDRRGRFRIAPGFGIWLPMRGARHLDLTVASPTGPLSTSAIRLGRVGAHPDDAGRIIGRRSPWWIAAYLVVQLGLVALPEEWFFRGYLQPRLDQIWGTPWKLFGADFGPGLIASAAAFALLHPILIPGAYRLLVFFPALMFGWLRARSGNLGPSVALHVGSNLLLAIVGRMYT